MAVDFVVGASILACLIFYITILSPHNPLLLTPSDWHGPPQLHLNSTIKHADEVPPSSPSPPPVSDVLTLEQIRDIVAPTRGFFSRDFSLHLGWNNMRYIIDAALLQAELLNRTLVLPSFIYARTCEYDLEVCADYAPMVNKTEALSSNEWIGLSIEQQMGFRIPISVMLDLGHLRVRYPVITVSDYLRLHGQDPESESSKGSWLRESYHTHGNVLELNGTKRPSLFVIENDWYDPTGTNRVDYIPQAMKRRGKWERYNHTESENQESVGYWPEEKPTTISKRLWRLVQGDNAIVDWNMAIGALRSSQLQLGRGIDLDDRVLEDVLNANGWEVLHTFSSKAWDFEKSIVRPLKQVVPRSSIRGFKDDYYEVDADVVVLAGETHFLRKPVSISASFSTWIETNGTLLSIMKGAMRFTEDCGRARFARMVVHTLISPERVLDLGEVLAMRMRRLNGGRLWMGAHLRRGDFVLKGWVMESTLEAHVKRVKDRLEAGRAVLTNLGGDHEKKKDGDEDKKTRITTYDIEGVVPDMEQTTLSPPRPDDRFYVATDERDSHALRAIRDAGGVFLTDLLTMEDRRAFGWPLMLTDVRAIVEQGVLAHSAYYYGHALSSFSGRVENLRAARGADRRTALLD
ncbi:hypothetical protein BJV74DRAFT_887716 [Russula compacta]|nr:hypothetical protein BJV74DRAFT_887716 [Russula compacta]